MSSPARKALDFFKGILYNKVRSCVPKNKEAYRSGHNGPDSKLRAFCDGAIPEKPDFMRVFVPYVAAVSIFILQFSHTFANKFIPLFHRVIG